MKTYKIAAALSALALATTLVACGSPSSYEQTLLDEASGIKVTAENASAGSSAVTENAITVEEGDVIVISPFTQNGSFHLTITSQDGKTTVYDDDASGKVLFSIEAEPGVYNVTTSSNGVTGWMTVFAESQDDINEQDEALEDAFEREGVEGEAPKTEVKDQED